MSMTRASSDRTRRRPGAGALLPLGAAVLAAALGCAIPEPAHAAKCSTDQATKIAVERYGGEALSVSPDGDYLIVRLRLPDGRVIDVAVDRWGC